MTREENISGRTGFVAVTLIGGQDERGRPGGKRIAVDFDGWNVV